MTYQQPQHPIQSAPPPPTVRLDGPQIFWILVWSNIVSGVIGGLIVFFIMAMFAAGQY